MKTLSFRCLPMIALGALATLALPALRAQAENRNPDSSRDASTRMRTLDAVDRAQREAAEREEALRRPGMEAKWISLFDGKTLKGWKIVQGAAKFEVRDGTIVGTVTAGERQNTFLVTEDDTFRDFVFEAEFRCDAGINSGVNFRSRPADDKVKRVYGLQYEIDPKPRALTGGVQEEGGDGRRGKDNWLAPEESGGKPRDDWNQTHGDRLKVGRDAWNTMRIEVRGPKIRTWLNGHLLADFSDNAPVAIPHGFFGLQVHSTTDVALFGKEVAFRNLRVQKLN